MKNVVARIMNMVDTHRWTFNLEAAFVVYKDVCMVITNRFVFPGWKKKNFSAQ